MLWSEFKTAVDELLAVERRRLGVQPFIDRQIRLGVGEIQRLIDYYRGGITTTFEFDDVTPDGFASRMELPKGANLRELYHIKTGRLWVRRPLHEYPFSNRHDLRAGVLGVGYENPYFRYALDHRSGARDLWVYPKVTEGYAVQVVWDALIGRGEITFKDTDDVPLDEPCASIVYDWVKSKLAKEVDNDLQKAREHERAYKTAISSLYSEVQERLRLKRAVSDADCVPSTSCLGSSPCDGLIPMVNCGNNTFTPGPTPGCGCGTSGGQETGGYGFCPEITMPQAEWVMVGDSGVRELINDTVAVATAIKAVAPEFVVHLGDATYQLSTRPGQAGTQAAANFSLGGSAHILSDLFIKHYWNFWDCNIYWAPGNHDLDTSYGRPMLAAMKKIEGLIGEQRVLNNQLFYTFARGPVRFIVLNSGLDENDPNLDIPAQIQFLHDTCAAATEPWLIAVFHRPSYSSDALHHPGSTVMRQLTDLMPSYGVDLVVNGHSHNYERVQDGSGLMHVICGLGGAQKRGAATSNLPDGSQLFYSDKNGFLHFKADCDTLQWELRTVDNEIIDRVTLRKTSTECSFAPDPCTGGGANRCSSNSMRQVYDYDGAGAPTFLPLDVNLSAVAYNTNKDIYVWNITAQLWSKYSSGGLVVVNTFADLRDLANSPMNSIAFVLGNLSPNDGLPRIYRWDSTSTDPDDGIHIGKPNDTAEGQPGRWQEWL